MRTSIRTPPGGRESIAISPPTRRSLSRMLTRPSPPLPAAEPVSKPHPSSETRREIASGLPRSSTRACRAPLCLMTFRRASWVMR